jgi:hypothetical protein
MMMFDKHFNETWRVIVLIGLATITACTSSMNVTSASTDLTQAANRSSQQPSTPDGDYYGVAWLGESRLAFEYAHDASAGTWDRQIAIYALDTKDWSTINVPKSDECLTARSNTLARLPNGNLGFLHQCNVWHGHVGGMIFTLYMWNVRTNTLQALQHFPENFLPGGYTFSPDMSGAMQVKVVGAGLDEQLHRVSNSGQMQRLFSDWQRVAAPAWSPNGQSIAFMGTETYPGRPSDDLYSSADIAGLLYYPWDLYVMKADGSDVRKVLSGVRGGIRWVPHRQLISFSGKIDQQEGIWLIDLNTQALSLIWPYPAAYDWSPDGKQMVVIEHVKQKGEEITRPVIVDVPLDAK